MNEEHVLAAILTAGLAAKSSKDLTPKDVVGLYGAVLAELLTTVRPPRPAQPAPG